MDIGFDLNTALQMALAWSGMVRLGGFTLTEWAMAWVTFVFGVAVARFLALRMVHLAGDGVEQPFSFGDEEDLGMPGSQSSRDAAAKEIGMK